MKGEEMNLLIHIIMIAIGLTAIYMWYCVPHYTIYTCPIINGNDWVVYDENGAFVCEHKSLDNCYRSYKTEFPRWMITNPC